VKIADGLLHLAFRVEREQFRGIVSCGLKPWICGPNQLAIAIRNLRVGLVPLRLESVWRQPAGQVLLEEGWKVHWQRTEQQELVLVNLDRGEVEQPILKTLELQPGVMRVAGIRAPLDSPEAAADETPLSEAAFTPALAPLPLPRLADQSASK
jgi:hypothetical protein